MSMEMKAIMLIFLLVTLGVTAEGQYREWQPRGRLVPPQHLVEVIIPEYRAEKRLFAEVLDDLSAKYGLQFWVEIAVEDKYVEPVISLEASNVTLKALMNRIVQATQIRPAEWGEGIYRSPRAGVYEIKLGDPSLKKSPMDIVIKNYELRCQRNARTFIANIRLEVPELKKIFPIDGLVGSFNPRPREGVCLTVENTTVRDLIKAVSLTDRSLNWMFILNKKDVKKSEWIVF